jgi:hypothetical protein
VLTERTDAVGAVFLGLTVGCARCHDSRFDDFSLADYYRLQAFLAAAFARDVVIKVERSRVRRPASQWVRSAVPRSPQRTISTVRHSEALRTPIHVLKRGNTENKGRQVSPRLPGLFTGGAALELPADAPKPRTALARRIASADNPLFARVMVNRIWQYHFGQGLVETANDLGVNGSRPSHPELLDWLAGEFIRGGWRLKPLHRLIVSSSTYQQASRGRDSRLGMAKDSRNRLLWRFARRRLSAEEVFDSLLLIAGRLNTAMGGPSVIPPVDPDLVKLLYAPAQWSVTPALPEHDRRTIYLTAKRNLRLPFLETFDQPDGQTSCPRRQSSTHALQALELLNGKRSNALAEAFLQRLRREVGDDAGRQVERAFLLAAGRPPTAKEKELCVSFLNKQPAKEFALAVFNLNAFLYID